MYDSEMILALDRQSLAVAAHVKSRLGRYSRDRVQASERQRQKLACLSSLLANYYSYCRVY
jgi:hypothetical protein